MTKKEIQQLFKQNREDAAILAFNSMADPDFPHQDDIDMLAAITDRYQQYITHLIQTQNELPATKTVS
ncbi:MAG: hypothetical protein ACT4OJ_04895 [Bacteroidota bacterium]